MRQQLAATGGGLSSPLQCGGRQGCTSRPKAVSTPTCLQASSLLSTVPMTIRARGSAMAVSLSRAVISVTTCWRLWFCPMSLVPSSNKMTSGFRAAHVGRICVIWLTANQQGYKHGLICCRKRHAPDSLRQPGWPSCWCIVSGSQAGPERCEPTKVTLKPAASSDAQRGAR